MNNLGIPSRHITKLLLRKLAAAGFEFDQIQPRQLCIECRKPEGVRIFLCKTKTLAKLVQEGVLDAALMQSVDFKEANPAGVASIDTGIKLGAIKLLVRKDVADGDLKALGIKQVFTRNLNLAKNFVQENGLNWEVKQVLGTTELYPTLYGKESAVIEYTRSGKTADQNNLKPAFTLAQSTALLIFKEGRQNEKEIQELAKALRT